MNPATAQARVVVDELVRGGIRDLCLAPGSRSTPLVLAAAERVGEVGRLLRMRVFLDERSAAFFALGLARATGRPAAVVTTSGTAVANLLPAAVEAAWAEVPLLLLTADRPPRLREGDANQVIRQPGIFGSYPVLALDLPEARLDQEALRHVRALTARAVAATRGLPPGPVHLNVPFSKPLEPGAGDSGGPGREGLDAGRDDGAPWTHVEVRRPIASDAVLDELAGRMGRARRGVLVAGPHPDADRLGPRLRGLADAWDVPLLADPLSGGRYGRGAPGRVPDSYDLLLRDGDVRESLAPDLVVRVGAAPTSAALGRWLDRSVDHVVIDAGRRWKDHQDRVHRVVQACAVDAVERLADRNVGGGDGSWTRRWIEAAAAARAAARGAEEHEGDLAEAVVSALPPGTPLFVSSSMPIRDVDAFAPVREESIPVRGNRGASGIDGIVSTALGVAAGHGRPGVALVGDLAFLHDVNGLLAARESDAAVVFVVVNNDGGGIFHMLPIREMEPAFTPFFATPHGADLSHGAALYGVPHRRVGAAELPGALSGALRAGRTSVLEIRTDRDANARGHADAERRAIVAARQVLGLGGPSDT